MIATTTIIQLLQSTQRTGMEELIAYMERHGFFKSPASTKYHGVYPGGLAEHSLGVYRLLVEYAPLLHQVGTTGQKPLPIDTDTFIIAALLHDVCKIGAYDDVGGRYTWNRQQPKGHALLSLARIWAYIKLKPLEEMMIKYHMGPYGLFEFEPGKGEYPLRGDPTLGTEERYGNSLANAWFHNPVVKLMYFCDELETLGVYNAEKETTAADQDSGGSNNSNSEETNCPSPPVTKGLS